MAGEFSLIKKYFDRTVTHKDVIRGIGDDAALLSVPLGEALVVTTDTLNINVHFPQDTSPEDLAYKAVMVNLSDLAAMGATARWITLSLSLPHIDELWLQAFSQSLHAVLTSENVALVGGDTTRGPLAITITAMGSVLPEHAMRRDNAKPGDIIAVTGTLGDAALGLQCALRQRQLNRIEHTGFVLSRLNRPTARTRFARAIAGLVPTAIDLSDGLFSDIQHILTASGCGAEINVDTLPISDVLQAECDADERIELALSGGDDYELCVVFPAAQWQAVSRISESQNLRLTRVGIVNDKDSLRLVSQGKEYRYDKQGWDHFS